MIECGGAILFAEALKLNETLELLSLQVFPQFPTELFEKTNSLGDEG